jgi:hypothetical protein
MLHDRRGDAADALTAAKKLSKQEASFLQKRSKKLSVLRALACERHSPQ